MIAADEPAIESAAARLRSSGTQVQAVQADLSTGEGVTALCNAIGGRPIDALLANAGTGLGKGFLDQDFDRVRRVVDTNVTGTLELVHRIARDMRLRGQGRILHTGSIAGFVPGSFHAAYNGSKAFIDSFAFALRDELKDSGVSVTCLMPGATDTDFFRRAGMLDTKVGTMKKDDPAKVARDGFKAMMKGEGDVVSGLKNKLQVALALVTPAPLLAAQHRKQAAPGTAEDGDGDASGQDRHGLPVRALGGLAAAAATALALAASARAGAPGLRKGKHNGAQYRHHDGHHAVQHDGDRSGSAKRLRRRAGAQRAPGPGVGGLALMAGLGLVYAAWTRRADAPAATAPDR